MSKKLSAKELSVNQNKIRLTAENGNLIVNTVDENGELVAITSTTEREQEISSLAALASESESLQTVATSHSTYGAVRTDVARGEGSSQQTFILDDRQFSSKPIVTATLVGNENDPKHYVLISDISETSTEGIYQVTFEFSDDIPQYQSNGTTLTNYKLNILAVVDGTDTDLDGIPDHTDTDDDNDGILDVDEPNPILTEDEDSGFYLVNDAITTDTTSSLKRPVYPIISSDGNCIAVGYPVYGKVKVFDIDGSNGWVQRGSDITFSGSINIAGYGLGNNRLALSTDKNTLAIAMAAPYYSGNFLKVYKWENNSWNRVGSDISPTDSTSNFGMSVDLSDDGQRMVVGDNNIGFRVYDLIDGEWSQVGSTVVKNGYMDQVSCNSNCTIIAHTTKNSHSAYIYEWNSSNSDWEQKGSTITVGSTVTQPDNALGIDITSDGSTFSITNPLHRVARVYEWDDSNNDWSQKGSQISMSSPNNGQMATYLSDDAETLFLGDTNAGMNNNSTQYAEGEVRIFSWNTTNQDWDLVSTIEGEEAGEQMGIGQLTRNGERFVVGPAANYHLTIDEYARVYQISNS